MNITVDLVVFLFILVGIGAAAAGIGWKTGEQRGQAYAADLDAQTAKLNPVTVLLSELADAQRQVRILEEKLAMQTEQTAHKDKLRARYLRLLRTERSHAPKLVVGTMLAACETQEIEIPAPVVETAWTRQFDRGIAAGIELAVSSFAESALRLLPEDTQPIHLPVLSPVQAVAVAVAVAVGVGA